MMRLIYIVFAMAAVLLAAAIVSCQASYTWGPSGRSFSINANPALIEPGIGLIERHWADEH